MAPQQGETTRGSRDDCRLRVVHRRGCLRRDIGSTEGALLLLPAPDLPVVACWPALSICAECLSLAQDILAEANADRLR